MSAATSYFSCRRCVLLVMGDQVIALGWLVGYFVDESADSWEGWIPALCVVVSTIIFKYVASACANCALTILSVLV